MSTENKEELVFKALADGRRRLILDLLSQKPHTTGELCDHFEEELNRCTVMQHMRALERADLIVVRRVGRTRWNYLNAAPLKDVYDRWISPYAENAVELMAKLKRDLEAA